MENISKDNPSARMAVAFTDNAEASFVRTAPNAAEVELAYEVGALAANLSADSLQIGVAAICEREIEIMRGELMRLGEQLASQLSHDGRAIGIDRKWHDHDKRKWKDTRSAFYVKGSSYRSRERVSVPADAADAHLVRSVIDSTIAQREQSIRNTYAKILSDAQAKRSSVTDASSN